MTESSDGSGHRTPCLLLGSSRWWSCLATRAPQELVPIDRLNSPLWEEARTTNSRVGVSDPVGYLNI